jgi:hypothetical protein
MCILKLLNRYYVQKRPGTWGTFILTTDKDQAFIFPSAWSATTFCDTFGYDGFVVVKVKFVNIPVIKPENSEELAYV